MYYKGKPLTITVRELIQAKRNVCMRRHIRKVTGIKYNDLTLDDLDKLFNYTKGKLILK